MPESLLDLEQQRQELLRQISLLGDFRRGSITPTTGTCGKATCHCHQPQDPGHGPNWRLTYKDQGKTQTETFSSPAALRKAQQEVAAYHRFRELSQTLLEISEQICRKRPVEETARLTPQEKKRAKRSRKRSAGK